MNDPTLSLSSSEKRSEFHLGTSEKSLAKVGWLLGDCGVQHWLIGSDAIQFPFRLYKPIIRRIG